MKKLGIFVFVLITLISSITAAYSESTDNLAKGAPVTTTDKFSPNLSVVTDGAFAIEGSPWNDPTAVTVKKKGAILSIDLGEVRKFIAVVIQADWNDAYIIEGSVDGTKWSYIWFAPQKGYTQGLRTRGIEFRAPRQYRYVRVRGGEGDGVYSISELQLFETTPPNWSEISSPTLVKGDRFAWVPFLSVGRNDLIREIVAALAAMLFIWGMVVTSLGGADHHRKLRRGLLVACAVISYIGWSNFFQFHYTTMVHRHEFYHYYLGSKYNKELSYTRLYECTIVADKEDNFLPKRLNRKIRNLKTNVLESTDKLLADPSQCLRHFSPERWESFKKDLSWFRTNMPEADYTKCQTDHGFNATPVWTVMGSFLSNLATASDLQIFSIGALDIVLLTIMWAVVFSTFGLEAGCIAVVFWGCNFIARFAWTGAAFLRADWLVWGVIGICLLKRRRMFGAGFLLGYSGLLRIFPFAFLGGIFFRVLYRVIAERNLKIIIEYKHLALGVITSSVIFITLGTMTTGGLGTWQDFFANTKKHFETTSTNMIGLKPLVSTSNDMWSPNLQDPTRVDSFEPWWQAKAQLLEDRLWIFWTLTVRYLIALARASSRVDDWGAACLGAGMITLINLSNYDYYALLPLAFLTAYSAWPALLLLILAWLSWKAPLIGKPTDQVYFIVSVLSITYVWFVTFFMAWRRGEKAGSYGNDHPR